MSSRRHRPKPGWASDRLVLVDVARLKAEMERLRVSPTELARRIGDHQQTIDAMLRREGPRRARESRVAAIARALRVPEGMLRGEAFALPGDPLVRPGYEYLYSARTELAASRLFTQVYDACLRDVARAPERFGELRGYPPQVVADMVAEALCRLIRIGDWRQKLLVWNPDVLLKKKRAYTEPPSDLADQLKIGEPIDARPDGPPIPAEMKIIPFRSLARPQRDPAHEEAVLGLIAAVEHVLRPWFDGQAALNLAALEAVAHYQPPPAGSQKQASSKHAKRSPAKPKRSTKRRT